MSKYLDSFINIIGDKRERAINGIPNCVPFILQQMQDIFPGLGHRQYLAITGGNKDGKTTLMSQFVLYHTLDMAYNNPSTYRVHFLYFSLEENFLKIFARYTSYLLYKIYNVRCDYNHLMSANLKMTLPKNIYDMFLSDTIQEHLRFFDNNVDIITNERNSIGIIKKIREYANSVGTTYYKKDTFIDQNEQLRHYVDKYVINDPEIYYFVIIDNYNNLIPTRNEKVLYSSILTLSSEIVTMKDLYGFTFVALIQQTDSETNSLEAYKYGNIIATKAGLRDFKQLGGDITDLWGISNPGNFNMLNEWPKNNGYDLNKFKRRYFRVFNIILSRNGEANYIVPLFFDGAVSSFEALPAANNYTALDAFYKKIELYENDKLPKKSFLTKILRMI